MRAEAAGDPSPWRRQATLGWEQREADALRDIVREYALETLADADAVLVIDETGFLNPGTVSCGVARQYTGSAGKITNRIAASANVTLMAPLHWSMRPRLIGRAKWLFRLAR